MKLWIEILSTMLAGLVLAVSVSAQPAPWYLWKSKLNGKTYCQQTSPGEGWERVGGPFKDSNCKMRG